MIKKQLLLLIVLFTTFSFAQRNNISPYSFFGIGEESAQKTVEEMTMGEIGAAFSSQYQLSFTNPAALGNLRLTSYALAGANKLLSIDDGTTKDKASTASLTYLAIGVPIGTKAGFAFGIQPNTTVGYSLTEEFRDTAGDLTAINLYTGDGGTNRVFIGFGYQIVKNLNVGFEAAYVFGNIENSLLNRRDGVSLATKHKVDSDVRGIASKIGVQYKNKINEKLTLNVGGVFHLNNDLSNKGTEYLFSLINNEGGIEIPRDTILNKSFEATIKKPLTTILSVGIGEENKWYAGLEYSFQDALEFTDGVFSENTLVSYDKMNRVSFGGYYTPKINSITNYWERATYMAGVHFKKSGLLINDTAVNDFGISFGVGLPVGQNLSKVNLGFEIGKRGEITSGLVKENYFNLRLSLTLNDRWFLKQKLN